MFDQIPTAGTASAEIAEIATQSWQEAAAKSGVDLKGFNPQAPLQERLVWADRVGLVIAAVLSRFSSKLQQSTASQVQECVAYAASHGSYVPPELICVDEAVSGRKTRRDGLQRMKAILQLKLVSTLLVFKVSRLFRVAYKGFQFFQEEVVEENLRAISVSQGIDTRDEKTWKQLAYLHGIMDEMLLGTIADHVRSGLANLFNMGFVVGALTVGYAGKVVEGAGLTNQGLPRKVPAIVPEVAQLIRQHYEWIRDGMPIREGWRRWLKANGPHDPRSTCGYMTYGSYRRMLSNPRYTGRFAFGRKRNQWSSKRDYNKQVPGPECEVKLVISEELRIVSDELYFAVQKRLDALKTGSRSHKKRQDVQLSDLVTDCFVCSSCVAQGKVAPFYQAGRKGMRCKHTGICSSSTIVRRQDAVAAVCKELSNLLQKDGELLEQTIAFAREFDAQGDEGIRQQIAGLQQQISACSRKLDDLIEMAGEGSEADRKALKAKVRTAQLEREEAQTKLSQLERTLADVTASITPEQVRASLADLTKLLTDGAAGKLGQDAVYRAANVFRQLVGGRIEVMVEARPGRKSTNVRGKFKPALLRVVQAAVDDCRAVELNQPEVTVWLRQPPKRDQLAERVHMLIDVVGHSYRSAAKVLQAEGHRLNSGVVWQIYRRYYEMIGESVPEVPYNNGRKRKTA